MGAPAFLASQKEIKNRYFEEQIHWVPLSHGVRERSERLRKQAVCEANALNAILMWVKNYRKYPSNWKPVCVRKICAMENMRRQFGFFSSNTFILSLLHKFILLKQTKLLFLLLFPDIIILWKELFSQSLRINQVGGCGYANALATDVMT